jgi:16S rRNA G966 N2-methylase RsmD
MLDDEKKRFIANKIKNLDLYDVEKDMDKLIMVSKTNEPISDRSRIGNNVVDYFTFVERLETKGKYNVTFYEFVENIETFKKKKFIQTMFHYYDEVKNKNRTKNEYVVMKEVYNICISAINIMRPLNCIELYKKYNAKRVLNFCAGWGGSTVGCSSLNLEHFYGIEINHRLKPHYERMIEYLNTKSTTKVNMFFCDATTFDYSTIDYDTVFASPPYYFIEKYPNNIEFKSKEEMNKLFYIPLFTNSYAHLKPNGHYIINVCKEIYDVVLMKLFGEAHYISPLKKSKRQNNYTEMIYVWKKHA